jgi:hypothetical protein
MPTDGITSNDSRLYKEEEELKIELFFYFKRSSPSTIC